MSPKKNNLKLSKETKEIDFFMRRIYERCKSKLNLHNIASHNIGNMYGQYLRNQDIEKSSSKKLPYTIWVILSSIFNENMSIINNSGVSIFIDIKREILHERISRNDKRPLLSGDVSLDTKLSDLYKERIEYYQKSKYHVSKDVRDRVLSIINSYS